MAPPWLLLGWAWSGQGHCPPFPPMGAEAGRTGRDVQASHGLRKAHPEWLTCRVPTDPMQHRLLEAAGAQEEEGAGRPRPSPE